MPTLWKDLSKINDYSEYLETCWNEHLAPRSENAPTVISTNDALENIFQYGFCENLSQALKNVIPYIPQYGDGGDVTGKNFFSTKRLAWNKPFRTISKDMVGSRSGMVHPTEHRLITIAEAARGGSFPDKYKFIGGYKNALMRIGNSVPPLFMRAIAIHIKKEILQMA